MKANVNDWHAKVYNFTYDGGLPNNLCPYFWKTVLGVILLIPNFILQLPCIIVDKFDKEDNAKLKTSDRMLIGVIVWIGLLILGAYIYNTYHYVKWFLKCYSYNNNAATWGGILNSGVLYAIIHMTVFEIRKSIKLKKMGYEAPEKKPNLLVEFVKAKYNKYCPIIEWEK